MKRFVLTLLSIAMVPVLASAQEQGWAAKFFPNGLTHNFGTVAFGSSQTHKFLIKNIYNVPFQVTEARVSCGCVEAKKSNLVIPPNGIAEIEAVMNTRRIPLNQLNQLKTVNIAVTLTSVQSLPTDKLFSSSCTLAVSCVAKTNLRFSSEKINFGVVQAGQTPLLTMDIEYANNPNWKIESVVKNDYPLDVVFQPLPPRQPGVAAYRVGVTLHKDAPAGELKHVVQLQTNGDPQVLELLVEGVIQAPLAATPNNANFGKVAVNSAVVRHIVIRGTNTPFKITGVSGVETGDGLNVRLPEKAAPVQVVTIEYQPNKAAELNKKIALKTDLNDLSVVITVEGKAE
jgi:hypothetical protein